MKKRFKNLILIILIIFILLLIFVFSKFTGYLVKEQKEQVQFYFYDEITNCSLNGYIFTGDKLIGESEQGYFNLTYKNYIDNFIIPGNISIFGKLGGCFNENYGLYFDKYWEAFEIKKYYFSGESIFDFKAIINQNNPSKRELIRFIQPNKVKDELSKINLNNNQDTLNSLSKINNYLNNKVDYTKDWDFNKETNYWQTPEQTLSLEKGDCEDYSTALLSLFLAYNNSLNCYNIVFTSHVTTFCKINNYYIYYDQGKTEVKKQAATKEELTKLKQNYLEDYGININNITETKAHYAFNDNQYIKFDNEDDFINWQYNLKNTKKEFNLFEDLEKQAIELNKLYVQEESVRNTGELATQSPSAQLQTAKSFPYFIIFILIALFIALIIILIRINKKHQ